jgi:Glycosyltransferase family 10 (fucosyltransferase) C-term
MRVGIYDEFFRRNDPSMTHHQALPDDFEYVDNCDDPARVDVVLGTFSNLEDVLRSRHPKRVYYLQETTAGVPPYDEHRYRELPLILTNDQRVLDRHRNARYLPFVGTTITDFAPAEKTRGISFVASALRVLPGHQLRHAVAADAAIMEHVDGFGRAFDNYVPDKRATLASYRFSIVIENARYPHYVTEKLFDCFATGTVPLYWGEPGRLPELGFDLDGIIEWSTIDDLRDRVACLARFGEAIYPDLAAAVERNRHRAHQFRCHEILLEQVLREVFGL